MVCFASRSPLEASCSFADFGPRLISFSRLYLLGLCQRGDCASGVSFASCAVAEKEPRRRQSATDARTIGKPLILAPPRPEGLHNSYLQSGGCVEGAKRELEKRPRAGAGRTFLGKRRGARACQARRRTLG